MKFTFLKLVALTVVFSFEVQSHCAVINENAFEAKTGQIIMPWNAKVEQVTAKSQGRVLNLEQLIDGNYRRPTLFDRLKGSTLCFTFKTPQKIGLLAMMQSGHTGWALPKTITLIADDTPVAVVNLALRPTLLDRNINGAVQMFRVNATCRKLELRIDDIYQTGSNLYGGIGDIGEVIYAPAEYVFDTPLQQGHQTLALEIESPREVLAQLDAKIVSEKLTFTAPPFFLKKGLNSVNVKIADFKPKQNYAIDWNPSHLLKIRLRSSDDSVPFHFVAVKPEPKNVPADRWYELPPFTPPTKVENGIIWTEGMSYSSVGKFANAVNVPLLTETVGNNWFQTNVSGGGKYRAQVYMFRPETKNQGALQNFKKKTTSTVLFRTKKKLCEWPLSQFYRKRCGTGFLLSSNLQFVWGRSEPCHHDFVPVLLTMKTTIPEICLMVRPRSRHHGF